MTHYTITNTQARLFILAKQGLIGEYKFEGKQGICDYIKQAGCIQYDPIDVCGKNSELVLQSRVKGFTKQMLYDLLYVDRKLIDYFDKNLSIISVDDWKYFEPIRTIYKNHTRSRNEIEAIAHEVKAFIKENGYACSKDLHLDKKVDWYWSKTKLSRAALETLYFRGDLVVHHKKGTVKYYALAEDHLPPQVLTAENPHKNELAYQKWRVLRRISAVGLLWNRPSDAWLNIDNFKAQQRNNVISTLKDEGELLTVNVEEQRYAFYCLAKDKELLENIIDNPPINKRTELIAPLDGMLWDRKLIKELFDFDYKWEIYTPENKRKYGYYVLPILSGDQFVGRAEIVKERRNRNLLVKNIWWENNILPDAQLQQNVAQCLQRFAVFNECHQIKGRV